MTRGGILSSSARSVNDGTTPFDEPADGAARADVHGDDVEHEVAVDRRRVELDVVDADDLAAVDVDDLLIEQVALEQQHAVGRRCTVPRRGVAGGADASRRTT